MDIDHEQYRGHLDEEERARVIANATGPAGTNREYLFRTLENLTHLDVEEPALRRLADRVVELSRDG
jgi:cation transport regulator ChaC